MKTMDRRRFIVGATGLVTMPFLLPKIVGASTEADSRLLFKALMDDVDHFSDYDASNPPSINRLYASGNSPFITNERSRSGNNSLCCLLNRNSSRTSYRTEVTTPKNLLKFTETHWIGFSVYVPDDWEKSDTWEVIWQLHDHPLVWGQKLDFSPILGIRIGPNSDKWLIIQDYVQTPEGTQHSSDLRRGFSDTFGTVARGQWTDFVIEYCPDWRNLNNGGTGVTSIWLNGDQIVDYHGPNAVNQANSPYIKFGAYKSGWRDGGRDDSVVERVYHFDEFRVSRGNQGSYELVAPGGQPSNSVSGLARPEPPQVL
jgi:hypothetical protein